jgi:pycsar effector protein
MEARESATRADAKAATLLGVIGGASVIIITVLAAASRGDTSGWTAVALITGWVGAAALTGAAVLLVLAVRPYLHVLQPAGRRVSWMRFVGMRSPDEVISAVQSEVADTHPQERLLASRLLPLAELAHRKHRLIRIAADLVLAATTVVSTAAVLYALVI